MLIYWEYLTKKPWDILVIEHPEHRDIKIWSTDIWPNLKPLTTRQKKFAKQPASKVDQIWQSFTFWISLLTGSHFKRDHPSKKSWDHQKLKVKFPSKVWHLKWYHEISHRQISCFWTSEDDTGYFLCGENLFKLAKWQ